MTPNSIPEPTLEQELNDLAIAHAQLRTARIRQHRITEDARALNPASYRGDVSVYVANVDVVTAENILNNLIEYYQRRAEVASNTTSAAGATVDQPLTNLGVVEIEDSDEEPEEQDRSSSPAPAYSSWPSTPPHFYAALAEDTIQAQPLALSVPSTPSRRPQDDGASSRLLSPFMSPPPSTQPRVGAPAIPSTPRHVTPRTATVVDSGAAGGASLSPPPSTQPRVEAPATPSTPRRVAATIVGNGGVLTSPDPTAKHWIVTRGRRTGIYATWAEAHAYTNGLGSAGSWQGFTTYKKAFDGYMRAREFSLLRVIRLPEDTEELYGPLHAAEDL